MDQQDKRRTFTKVNCEYQPFLYRVNGKKISRVPLAVASLHRESSFILVDEHRMGGKVYVWCGADCLIFAKNLARQIGQEISHDELHEWKNAYYQFEQDNADAPTPEELIFWERLGAPGGNRVESVPSAGEVDTSPCRLFQFDPSAENGAKFSAIAESLQFDWEMLSPSDGGVLMDCGEGENYLWLGEDATEPFRQEAIAAATAHMNGQEKKLRPSLVIIEPANDGRHNEKIVLFHQRFSKFGTRRAGNGDGPKTLQAVSAEVERMCARTTGTLRMVHEDSDGAMSGHVLPMKLLLDDNTAKLQHLVLAEGAWKALPAERAGVFASEEAVAVLFTCKNGSRRILYLWGGEGEGAAQGRGAIAVKATELDGRADQIQLQHGTEPPFFLLAHELAKKNVILLAGQGDATTALAPASPPTGAAAAQKRDDSAEIAEKKARLSATRIFCASAASSAFLGGRRGLVMAEQDLASLSRSGLAPRKSYVAVTGLPTARLADGAAWPEPQVSVYHGPLAPPAVRDFASQEANADSRLRRFLAKQHNMATENRSAPATTATAREVSEAIAAAKPLAFIDAEEQGWPEELSASRIAEITESNAGTQNGKFPARPVRLFKVSATTRATGAMFVREVGGGDTFRQSDLETHETFVLEAGDGIIFAWHGPRATEGTRELGLEVARAYAEETARIASSAVPAIIQVSSAEEPPAFIWCFRQWRHCLQTAAKAKLHISVTGTITPASPAGRPQRPPTSTSGGSNANTRNSTGGGGGSNANTRNSTGGGGSTLPPKPKAKRESRSLSPVPSPSNASAGGLTVRSVSPAGKKNRTYRKHDCAGNMFLYRVDRKRLCRVPLAASSLDRDSSFILVDEQRMGGKVYVWCGRDCQVLAKNLAKQLGQEISHDELHEWKEAFYYFEEGSEPTALAADDEKAAFEAFWAALGEKEGGSPAAVEARANDADGAAMVLYQMDNEGGWARVGESTSSFEWGFLSPADGAVLLECPIGELYLWIGEQCSDDQREAFRAAGLNFKAQADLNGNWGVSSLVILEPAADGRHNEKVVLFHQRFSKFGTKKAANDDKNVELVPIEVEVERMHSPHTGTLRIIEEEVDLAMSGHPIPFALVGDETAALTSWRMVNQGGGAWVFEGVSEDKRGLLTSEDAYAVLYTCKNGARRVLYLWVGSGEGALQAKGAMALKAAELDRRADQVQLMQGEEAPFFLVSHARTGSPLIICHGSAATATAASAAAAAGTADKSLASPRSPARCSSPSTSRPSSPKGPAFIQVDPSGWRVWAIGAASALPSAYSKSGLWAAEQDLGAVKAFGLCDWRSYVAVRTNCGSGDKAGDDETVALWHGAEVPSAVRAFAETLVEPQSRLMLFLLGESSRNSSNGCALTGPNGAAEFLDLLAAAGSGSGGGGSGGAAVASAGEPWLHTTRPLRLFKVSGTTRATGAMFVREIGPGECFRQQDLEQHESFVVDAGCATVYLWHGAAANAETRALSLDVALQYIQTLPGLKKGSRFELQQVYAGREPAGLVWCFRQWDTKRHAEYAAGAKAPETIVLSAGAPPSSIPQAGAPPLAPTAAAAAAAATTSSSPVAPPAQRKYIPHAQAAATGSSGAASGNAVGGREALLPQPPTPSQVSPHSKEESTGGAAGNQVSNVASDCALVGKEGESTQASGGSGNAALPERLSATAATPPAVAEKPPAAGEASAPVGGGTVDAEAMFGGRYDEAGNIRELPDGVNGGRKKLASLMSKFEKGA